MNKSILVHLKNKYPDAHISASESAIDVHGGNGEHLVALRKNGGSGNLECASESMGLSGRFCLAPIPKDARVHKLQKDGKIALDEAHEERKKLRESFQCDKSGKIKSIEELTIEGWKFDSNGRVIDTKKA